MRSHCFVFFLLIQLFPPTAKDISDQHPVPPAVREADKQTNNSPMEAPMPSKPKQLNVKHLREEAAELSQLSAGIPQRIEYVNKGQLPKDLNDQLKRIEKLAKHLRGEIYP
jgi:hypothetical protein